MSTMIVKIPRSKVEELSECAEKMLRYGGKIMQCLEDMQNEEMGERHGGMGMRDMNYRYPGMGMRGRMGMRDDDYSEEGGMGERRDSRGRYM